MNTQRKVTFKVTFLQKGEDGWLPAYQVFDVREDAREFVDTNQLDYKSMVIERTEGSVQQVKKF